MEKTIKIGDIDVKLNNNAAWAMEYQDQFGEDILPVALPLAASVAEAFAAVLADAGPELNAQSFAEAIQGRAVEILAPIYQSEIVKLVYNVTWSLAKNADPDIPEPKKWIRQFDTFPLDVVIPEVYGMIIAGFASSKNLPRLEKAKDEIVKTLQPSL